MSGVIDTHSGRHYAVVDVSDNSTTVYAGKCRLWGVYVNTVLSAHACPLEDSTTAIYTLIASLAAGQNLAFPGTQFNTSLVVDPDDAATGNITVCYEPLVGVV